MKYIHLFMAALAAYRMVELFSVDRITEPLRKKYPSYLWTCQRCLSVWAGIVVTITFVFFPWINWPLAFSWMYLTHNEWVFQNRVRKQGRQLLVEVDQNGNAKLLRAELNEQELSGIFEYLQPKVK